MTDSDNLVVRTPQDLYRVPLAPRRKRMPIPSIGIFDDPTVCLKVNREWYSHVLGVLQVLCEPDAWEGTDDEVLDAIGEIEKMLATAEENCEMTDYVKFIGDCNSDGLLVTQVVGGVETSERIDVWSCLGLPTTFITDLDCEGGSLTYTAIARGGEEQEIPIDLNECNPPIVPVPSLVGDDLWFDTDGDTIADLNVGRVVFPGEPGEPGEDGNTPIPSIVLSDLWFDTNGDGIEDVNVGQVVGEDGVCEGCDQAPAPEQIDEPANDGLMCSIAINEAAYVRRLWDKIYTDTNNAVNDYINGLLTGASVLAYFFPGVGMVTGVIGTIFLNAAKLINQAEANEFDDDFEEKIRCDLLCILQEFGKTTMTPEVQAEWAGRALLGATGSQAYVFEIISSIPLTEFQWVAYASSEVDPLACADCDCEDDDPNCIEVDFESVNGGWTAGNAVSGWLAGGWRITSSGSDDTLNINSTDRYTGTIVSVEVTLAAGLVPNSRLLIQRNNGTKSTVYTGGSSVMAASGLTYAMTDDTFGVTVDYVPGGSATHPQRITKIKFCFSSPPVVNP